MYISTPTTARSRLNRSPHPYRCDAGVLSSRNSQPKRDDRNRWTPRRRCRARLLIERNRRSHRILQLNLRLSALISPVLRFRNPLPPPEANPSPGHRDRIGHAGTVLRSARECSRNDRQILPIASCALQCRRARRLYRRTTAAAFRRRSPWHRRRRFPPEVGIRCAKPAPEGRPSLREATARTARIAHCRSTPCPWDRGNRIAGGISARRLRTRAADPPLRPPPADAVVRRTPRNGTARGSVSAGAASSEPDDTTPQRPSRTGCRSSPQLWYLPAIARREGDHRWPDRLERRLLPPPQRVTPEPGPWRPPFRQRQTEQAAQPRFVGLVGPQLHSRHRSPDRTRRVTAVPRITRVLRISNSSSQSFLNSQCNQARRADAISGFAIHRCPAESPAFREIPECPGILFVVRYNC